MADLRVEGADLVLGLTPLEKVESVHGEVRVPISSVTKVEVLDDAVAAVHGFRVGTGIPGAVAVGTFTARGAKTFAVVHHNTPRGLRISLSNAQYDQLIVGCDNPDAVAAGISNH
jgi:hypothetical protein